MAAAMAADCVTARGRRRRRRGGPASPCRLPLPLLCPLSPQPHQLCSPEVEEDRRPKHDGREERALRFRQPGHDVRDDLVEHRGRGEQQARVAGDLAIGVGVRCCVVGIVAAGVWLVLFDCLFRDGIGGSVAGPRLRPAPARQQTAAHNTFHTLTQRTTTQRTLHANY